MTTTITYAHEEPYRQLGPRDLHRPLIDVRLTRGGTSFRTLGLIDSGADTSQFNLQWAQAFGLALDPIAAEKTQGVGGRSDTWYFDIELTVLGRRFPARVGFCATMPTSFGLLGREDFFRTLRVGFDQRGRLSLLRPLAR